MKHVYRRGLIPLSSLYIYGHFRRVTHAVPFRYSVGYHDHTLFSIYHVYKHLHSACFFQTRLLNRLYCICNSLTNSASFPFGFGLSYICLHLLQLSGSRDYGRDLMLVFRRFGYSVHQNIGIRVCICLDREALYGHCIDGMV